MMDRYDVGEYDSGMVQHSDGDWVKYDDVEKLEELNREMVEALTLIWQTLVGIGCDTLALQLMYKTATMAIKKAEGRGE